MAEAIGRFSLMPSINEELEVSCLGLLKYLYIRAKSLVLIQELVDIMWGKMCFLESKIIRNQETV